MSNIFDLFKKIEKKSVKTPITHIIAGLGNPGLNYAGTRHNVGFLAVDKIAESCNVKIDRMRFKALTAEATLGGIRVRLMKPQTYMNLSGEAIGAAAAFYKIPQENIIVLHDEISFAPGVIRIRRKGNAGGHNGLKSIIEHISGELFPRIKIGVGQKPSADYDLADWVLGKIPKDDLEKIEAELDSIVKATELILVGKIDEAMNRFSK